MSLLGLTVVSGRLSPAEMPYWGGGGHAEASRYRRACLGAWSLL